MALKEKNTKHTDIKYICRERMREREGIAHLISCQQSNKILHIITYITGTHCRIRRSRASQTCSMGDMSGEYAGHARAGMFSASRNCVQILATWGCALSCCNMRWWSWMNGTTMGLMISSWYLCAFKMPSIKSITYACPYHNPTTTMGHSIHNVDFSKPLTHTTPNRDSSVKRTPLQSARRHRMWAFAHSSRLRRRTAVRSRPRWGRRACRWASLRWFLTVCAEILWLCKPIVAAAVRVAGLRRSWRWRCWMWRSWAGVVTRGLRLWGRLDVLPNSLKRLWRQLTVEKWTFNSRATAFLQSACQLHAPSKLATSVALCCVIKLHILECPYIVASLRHLCNNHAV